MSSMAWVKRCYSQKWKNLNKLLVFEALYPQPSEDADFGKLQVNSAEKSYNIQKHLIAHAQYVLNILDKMASSR